MAPTTPCCPHLACPASGQTGQGNIDLHACTDQRCMCPACHKTFSARHGTALYRWRTSAETVSLGGTLMARGCPLRAIVVACGDAERTVACWLARAGVQGQAVPEPLVEHPRDLGPVQADGIRVKTQGGLGRRHATCRERLAALTRRGRALARRLVTWHHGMYRLGTVDNFCTPQASLRAASGATTPAMAAGSTEHCGTVRELLSLHGPPPRWTPPKQRGRPSRARQGLVARWCL